MTSAMRTYTAMLVQETEEGFEGYSASIPALPGCYSQGETVEEALANIREALLGYLESLAERDLPLPVEEQHPITTAVDVLVPA